MHVKIFGKELKFNGWDIWHKGSFIPSKVATSNDYEDLSNKPTKLSQFKNDIGAGAGLNIVTSPTEPTNLNAGDQWHKEV